MLTSIGATAGAPRYTEIASGGDAIVTRLTEFLRDAGEKGVYLVPPTRGREKPAPEDGDGTATSSGRARYRLAFRGGEWLLQETDHRGGDIQGGRCGMSRGYSDASRLVLVGSLRREFVALSFERDRRAPSSSASGRFECASMVCRMSLGDRGRARPVTLALSPG